MQKLPLLLFALAAIVWPRAAIADASPCKTEPAGNLKSYFTYSPTPNYPEPAMIWHRKGSGCYLLTIDPATGKVTEVKVVKSTGVKILDDSAATAFLQWKAKPHTTDHALVPVTFTFGAFPGSHLQW